MMLQIPLQSIKVKNTIIFDCLYWTLTALFAYNGSLSPTFL